MSVSVQICKPLHMGGGWMDGILFKKVIRMGPEDTGHCSHTGARGLYEREPAVSI